MDEPIACSLTAVEMRTQVDAWTALLRTTVTAVEWLTENDVRMRLQADPKSIGTLVALSQREVACCPFFRFAIEIDARGTAFTVSVPPDAAAILTDFVQLATPSWAFNRGRG